MTTRILGHLWTLAVRLGSPEPLTTWIENRWIASMDLGDRARWRRAADSGEWACLAGDGPTAAVVTGEGATLHDDAELWPSSTQWGS